MAKAVKSWRLTAPYPSRIPTKKLYIASASGRYLPKKPRRKELSSQNIQLERSVGPALAPTNPDLLADLLFVLHPLSQLMTVVNLLVTLKRLGHGMLLSELEKKMFSHQEKEKEGTPGSLRASSGS
jgi:hypothetical protein